MQHSSPLSTIISTWYETRTTRFVDAMKDFFHWCYDENTMHVVFNIMSTTSYFVTEWIIEEAKTLINGVESIEYRCTCTHFEKTYMLI